METEEKNKYENVDERQSEAYERLLDSYFNEVRKKYLQSDNNIRLYLLGRLESIIKEEPRIIRKDLFDGNRAKSIRLKNGLSLRELAKMVKMPLQSLVCYEKGAYAPGLKAGKGGRAYLEWLKDQGYEPFNLK